MNLFTPPTDNIYKFCGIAGLALFIYMSYFIFSPKENEQKQLKIAIERTSLESRYFILRDEMIFSIKDTVVLKKLSNSNFEDIGTTEFRKIIYSLPDKFKVSYKDIYIRKRNLDLKEIYLDSENNIVSQTFIIILLLLGEILCIWGLLVWYTDSKEAKDREERKLLSEELFTEHCQSCYKQFIFAYERATNEDGTVSKNFCNDCYSSGKYIEPDLTVVEGKNRLRTTLKKLKYKPRQIRKKLKNFERLSRWRRQRQW